MTVYLSIFLKAPRLGRVKARLAAEIGECAALRLYRVMAARALATARAAGLPTTIWYAPAEALEEMRRWLGEEWQLRPQASGDRGARLRAAARSVQPGAGWLSIGGDCPDLTGEHLRRALPLIEKGEVVLGPALDGGYYLVGGPSPVPDLFTAMPWSTDQLLEATRRRLEAAGIDFGMLPVLRNVATVADARAVGLLT